jgi:ethanolamine utilization protein EutN
MKLARVVGTVVSTINAPDLDDRTLLLCDLIEPSGKLAGGYLIAVDSVGAGAGETVLLLDEGNSARQVLDAPGAPIRTVIVGIVDDVTMEPVAPGANDAATSGTETVPTGTETVPTPRRRQRAPRRRVERTRPPAERS